MTLTADLHCSSGPYALDVQANGITINLNGHTLSGTSAVAGIDSSATSWLGRTVTLRGATLATSQAPRATLNQGSSTAGMVSSPGDCAMTANRSVREHRGS